MKVIIDIDEDEYEFCKRCADSELPKEMTTIDIVAFKVGKGTPIELDEEGGE
jgi:hypothetical protein